MGTAVRKKTYCRICTNQCGMVVDIEGERITKIRADREHPLSKGYSCPKGRAIGGIHQLKAALSFLGSPADIILHPADAHANGIAHGERVRVSTTRGKIFLMANVSETIRRGVASIPHGHEVANVNLLTSVEDVDRLTGMVLYTGIPINIRPAR